MFEMAHLYEDSLREYDELELCYLETGNFSLMPTLLGQCIHELRNPFGC